MGVTSNLYDSSGNIVSVVEAFKDITDKKMSEEFLKPSLQGREVLLKEILSHHSYLLSSTRVFIISSTSIQEVTKASCSISLAAASSRIIGSILRLFCGKRSIPFLGLTSPSKIPAMRIHYDLEG
jgi:hypothetical protein